MAERGDASSAAGAVYANAVLPQLARLLGNQDRDPASLTYGSFDRDHWAWKFRDFPLGMLQVSSYPLALAWLHDLPGNPYKGNPRLLQWIDAALAETVRRQHANGAFDGFSPNEQNAGPTLGIAHGLAETLRLVRTALTDERQRQVITAIGKACEFGVHHEEDHGFVSNHWALFAVACQEGFALTGRREFEQRATQIIDRIIAEQSSDGWYNEYGGPDPGYESLGIFHMAVYWRRTRSARALDSLRRSVEFYSHCVHPDGSVGGTYGSRHTGLYFPGGFEILAAELPKAAGVAAFMKSRLSLGNAVVPAAIDLENLSPLAYTYLEAALAAGAGYNAAVEEPPCTAFQGRRTFPACGLTVAGTQHYYAVVNAGKGGACRVFDRRTGRLAYEDASYLLEADGRRWTAHLDGKLYGKPGDNAENGAGTTARFIEARQEVVTPVRFLILRLLNLTVFRSLALGGWVRRVIVRRLITTRNSGPFSLRRSVIFERDGVHFEDELSGAGGATVLAVHLPRSYSSIHMGSAKYFHASELESLPELNTTGMAEELTRSGRSLRRFALRFSSTGPSLEVPGQRDATQPGPVAAETDRSVAVQ